MAGKPARMGQSIWLYNASVRHGTAAVGPWIPCRYPATLSYCFIKDNIFAPLFQMPHRFCADKHGECVSCLGAAHAETALTEMECHYCGDMCLSSLRSRLAFFSESNHAPRALSLFSSQQQGRESQQPKMSELTMTVPPRTSLSPNRELSPVLFKTWHGRRSFLHPV